MNRRDVRDIEKAMMLFLRFIAGDDPAAMIREVEVAKGHRLVPVGSVPWLPKADWRKDDVVSLDGSEVRLVAITALKPGAGAFHRLLDGIEAAGLKPVVVCPLPAMQSILIRWGWRCTEAGDSFETREEQWRPPSHRRVRGEAFASAGTGTPASASARAGEAGRPENGGN